MPPPAPPAELLFTQADLDGMRAYYAGHPELSPTPLRRLPALSRTLGLGGLWAKDETSRFGLPAFKAAGARFAIDALRADGRLEGRTIVCASEGNHGRAVAHAAREAAVPARVYLAASVAQARADAIAGEGAEVVRVEGTYDDAVRRAAAEAEARGWLVVSDTSWPGYEDIPRLIMLGYMRLLDEAAEAWGPGPDVVFVPGGVGGLLGAVAGWFALRDPAHRPAVICVEPARAACLQESARAGRTVTLPGPLDTVMGGLRCGEVSPLAFAHLQGWVDAYVAVEDHWSEDAMRRLARPGAGDRPIRAGASGAAALGGLLAALFDPGAVAVKRTFGLGPATRVMVFVTEGPTDPAHFTQTLNPLEAPS